MNIALSVSIKPLTTNIRGNTMTTETTNADNKVEVVDAASEAITLRSLISWGLAPNQTTGNNNSLTAKARFFSEDSIVRLIAGIDDDEKIIEELDFLRKEFRSLSEAKISDNFLEIVNWSSRLVGAENVELNTPEVHISIAGNYGVAQTCQALLLSLASAKDNEIFAEQKESKKKKGKEAKAHHRNLKFAASTGQLEGQTDDVELIGKLDFLAIDRKAKKLPKLIEKLAKLALALDQGDWTEAGEIFLMLRGLKPTKSGDAPDFSFSADTIKAMIQGRIYGRCSLEASLLLKEIKDAKEKDIKASAYNLVAGKAKSLVSETIERINTNLEEKKETELSREEMIKDLKIKLSKLDSNTQGRERGQLIRKAAELHPDYDKLEKKMEDKKIKRDAYDQEFFQNGKSVLGIK